jgi:hypothetical protein
VAEIVLTWRTSMLLLTLIAVGCSVQYWLGKPEPTLGGVYHVEFVVFSVMFLLACWTFRSELMKVDGLPPALPGFIDLTLTLATAGIALGGISQSNISLGAAPPWLIVLGPPLVMAAGIYFFELRGKRAGTLRWRACVGAALTAAIVIIPLKTALTAALPPVLAVLPLPSHL